MAKAANKAVVKSNSVELAITNGLSSLYDALGNAEKAVATRSKDAKKLSDETKKLGKKRAALLKRKKVAATKVKKAPSAESRKALKSVEKDLADIKKEIAKITPVKTANAEELTGLKANLKRASAYMKGIAAADKVLNKKPKKVKRRKKAKAIAA